MALAYDAERLTRDIDAAITHGHNAVIDAVRAVAAARGWPSTWLNEQATTYMPQIPDRHSQVVFDHPALQVAAASATHMLAMKARAARAQGTPPNQPALASCGEVQSRLALPTTATPGMSSWSRHGAARLAVASPTVSTACIRGGLVHACRVVAWTGCSCFRWRGAGHRDCVALRSFWRSRRTARQPLQHPGRSRGRSHNRRRR